MGTLRASLRLSSPDVLSTNLDFVVNSNVDVDSGNLQRVKVLATGYGPNAQIVHKSNQSVDRAYLFVRNLDPVKENYITIAEGTNEEEIVKLGGGEFCFFPVARGTALYAYGTKVDQLIEFGSFGLDSSAVRFT